MRFDPPHDPPRKGKTNGISENTLKQKGPGLTRTGAEDVFSVSSVSEQKNQTTKKQLLVSEETKQHDQKHDDDDDESKASDISEAQCEILKQMYEKNLLNEKVFDVDWKLLSHGDPVFVIVSNLIESDRINGYNKLQELNDVLAGLGSSLKDQIWQPVYHLKENGSIVVRFADFCLRLKSTQFADRDGVVRHHYSAKSLKRVLHLEGMTGMQKCKNREQMLVLKNQSVGHSKYGSPEQNIMLRDHLTGKEADRTWHCLSQLDVTIQEQTVLAVETHHASDRIEERELKPLLAQVFAQRRTPSDMLQFYQEQGWEPVFYIQNAERDGSERDGTVILRFPNMTLVMTSAMDAVITTWKNTLSFQDSKSLQKKKKTERLRPETSMEYAHALSKAKSSSKCSSSSSKKKKTVGCQVVRKQGGQGKKNVKGSKVKTTVADNKKRMKTHQKKQRDKSSARDKKKKDKSRKKSHRDDRF